jgi:hypothetical protein
VIFDADAATAVGLPAGVTGVAIAAVAVGVVLAGTFAIMKGYGRDPLERLAGWARARGLEYAAPTRDDVLATFAGEIEGRRVEVVVTRVARGLGSDLPPRVTTVTVGDHGNRPICTLQPAGWVLDRDGRALGERVLTGDASFDEQWSVRGDADGVALLVTPALRARLLAADADGLVIELSARAVAIPMPGVCTDPRELDRRMALAMSMCADPEV